MLKGLVCGGGSIHQEGNEPCNHSSSSLSSSRSRNKNKNKENAYAMRGLDKFALVLADLDKRKQKIYEETGSRNNDSIIRFTHSSSRGWKPIVIKSKDQNEVSTEISETNENLEALDMPSGMQSQENEVDQRRMSKDGGAKRKKVWPSLKLARWKREDHYFPLLIILILVWIMINGRLFAIMCTTILWYSMATIRKDSSSGQLVKKKKIDMDSNGITFPKSENL